MNATAEPSTTGSDATPLRHRARAEWFVWRVDHHLDGRMPRRRRREIRSELRANLAASAQHHGLRGAVDRLGHPATFAQGYIEGADEPVRWRTGAMVALATFVVLFALTLTFFLAFAAGAASVGGAEVSWHYAYVVAPGWGPLQGSGDGTRFQLALMSPVHLLTVATAWALGARIWRWRPSAR